MEVKNINIEAVQVVQQPAQKGDQAVEVQAAPDAPTGEAGRAPEPERTERARPVEPLEISPYSAFFVVDGNDDVVIVIVNEDGEVIKQFPPEEMRKTAEMLGLDVQHKVDLEV